MDLLEMSQNTLLLTFFIIGNIVSILLFFIILVSNIASKNRETKNIYFNAVLVSQIFYFLIDIIWAIAYFNDFEGRIIVIRYSKMLYFITGGFAAFCWFMYIEILMGARFSKTKKQRLLIGLPIVISTIFVVIISIATPDNRIVKNVLVSISQMYIPYAYIFFAAIYSIIMAIKTKKKATKRNYISLSIYPIGLVLVSLLQVFFLELPIFCLGTALLIVLLYIFKIQSQVSTDPLTGINNRGALTKYIGEYTKYNSTYVLMIDVDKFKLINDNFGHLEGDRALVILANALKAGSSNRKEKCFLARYGGDEFIIIASCDDEFDIDELVKNLHREVEKTHEITLKYHLSVSIGYSKVNDNESILQVIENADERMYENKSKKKDREIDKR